MFLVSFYEDDMFPFLLTYSCIVSFLSRLWQIRLACFLSSRLVDFPNLYAKIVLYCEHHINRPLMAVKSARCVNSCREYNFIYLHLFILLFLFKYVCSILSHLLWILHIFRCLDSVIYYFPRDFKRIQTVGLQCEIFSILLFICKY